MSFVFLPLAFIEGVGGPEMVMILLVVLVLFGGEKLPGFARGLGKSIREFKKAAAGVEEEFKRAIEEDDTKKPAPQILPATPVVTTPLVSPAPVIETTATEPAPTSTSAPLAPLPTTPVTHLPVSPTPPPTSPPANGFEHGRADI